MVDKHSTGGIGDKTSIALLPILSAMGLKVSKISGRGLGYTGGTVDKLESVKGFNAELDLEEFDNMIKKIGLSLTGQTPKLTPADGKIYSLRDITGTVDSPHLIAASIISKKIASGAKNILIDMKVGSGAFVANISDAKHLAQLMKKIANHFGRNLFVLFSSMQQPLGFAIGNKNEVVEAIESLAGDWPQDFYELIEKISIELYSKAKSCSEEEAKKKFDEVIQNGSATKKMMEWFKESGVENFQDSTKFEPQERKTILSTSDGFISFGDIKKFGNALIKIKSGRTIKGEKLDFDSGIKLFVKTGDKVDVGDKLFEITSTNRIPKEVIEEITNSIIIGNKKKENILILGELGW